MSSSSTGSGSSRTKLGEARLFVGTALTLIATYTAMTLSPKGMGLGLPLVLGTTYMNSTYCEGGLRGVNMSIVLSASVYIYLVDRKASCNHGTFVWMSGREACLASSKLGMPPELSPFTSPAHALRHLSRS